MNQMQNNCPQCGAGITAGLRVCKYCGESMSVNMQPQAMGQPQPQAQPQGAYIQQPMGQYPLYWPIKNKVVAGILGIFLGAIGVHKFYLGKVGMGVLYLLFSWTFIPAFIGFIEGIIYLVSNDHNFQIKNHVRLY